MEKEQLLDPIAPDTLFIKFTAKSTSSKPICHTAISSLPQETLSYADIYVMKTRSFDFPLNNLMRVGPGLTTKEGETCSFTTELTHPHLMRREDIPLVMPFAELEERVLAREAPDWR